MTMRAEESGKHVYNKSGTMIRLNPPNKPAKMKFRIYSPDCRFYKDIVIKDVNGDGLLSAKKDWGHPEWETFVARASQAAKEFNKKARNKLFDYRPNWTHKDLLYSFCSLKKKYDFTGVKKSLKHKYMWVPVPKGDRAHPDMSGDMIQCLMPHGCGYWRDFGIERKAIKGKKRVDPNADRKGLVVDWSDLTGYRFLPPPRKCSPPNRRVSIDVGVLAKGYWGTRSPGVGAESYLGARIWFARSVGMRINAALGYTANVGKQDGDVRQQGELTAKLRVGPLFVLNRRILAGVSVAGGISALFAKSGYEAQPASDRTKVKLLAPTVDARVSLAIVLGSRTMLNFTMGYEYVGKAKATDDGHRSSLEPDHRFVGGVGLQW